MNYLGIDISKKTFDVTIIKEDGSKEHKQFDNTAKGHEKLEKWLKRKVGDIKKVHAVMEATNIYWEEVAEYLHQKEVKVSVVNPAAIKGFARSEMQRNKTDKQDSLVIAEFGRQKKPEAWQPPLAHQKKLRSLVRHRQTLIKTRTQQKNRISSCNDEEVKQSLEQVLRVLEQQIEEMTSKINKLIKEHEDLHTNHRLMVSIKGIGDRSADLILAEFYDLRHYSSAKSVAADAGITPSKHESGTSVKRRAKISRIGKSAVRGILYWPAQTAILHNPVVRDLVERLEKRGKSTGVIIVAAMRKLLHLVYGVVKNQTPFDPNFC